MSTRVTFNSAHRILLASEFFVARRPVLDVHRQLAANELLFCHFPEQGLAGADATSASVIADVAQHGLLRIIGDVPAFLQIDADALLTDVLHNMPSDRVVPVLMESSGVCELLRSRIADMRSQNFRFALTLEHDSEAVRRLLPLVDTVRIDIAGKSAPELGALCRLAQEHGKKLLAESVGTEEDFQRCTALGCTLFRGYFFAQPQLIEGKRLSPSQLAITELMALVASDAESAEIEERIKIDPALGLNLLRLVNTPALSAHRIDSLRQALMILGRNQLQRWLQVMLYAEAGGSLQGMLPLLTLAIGRARLLELIAQKLRPVNRGIADTAFTVGIMSLMDTLFSMPMPDILQQIPVVDEVADALLLRKGYHGELLQLAEYCEWNGHDGTTLLPLLRQLRLSYHELYALQLAAFEWSNHIIRSLH